MSIRSRDQLPQSSPNKIRLTTAECAAATRAVLHRVDTGQLTHPEARGVLEQLGLIDPPPTRPDRPPRRPDGRS